MGFADAWNKRLGATLETGTSDAEPSSSLRVFPVLHRHPEHGVIEDWLFVLLKGSFWNRLQIGPSPTQSIHRAQS